MAGRAFPRMGTIRKNRSKVLGSSAFDSMVRGLGDVVFGGDRFGCSSHLKNLPNTRPRQSLSIFGQSMVLVMCFSLMHVEVISATKKLAGLDRPDGFDGGVIDAVEMSSHMEPGVMEKVFDVLSGFRFLESWYPFSNPSAEHNVSRLDASGSNISPAADAVAFLENRKRYQGGSGVTSRKKTKEEKALEPYAKHLTAAVAKWMTKYYQLPYKGWLDNNEADHAVNYYVKAADSNQDRLDINQTMRDEFDRKMTRDLGKLITIDGTPIKQLEKLYKSKDDGDEDRQILANCNPTRGKDDDVKDTTATYFTWEQADDDKHKWCASCCIVVGTVNIAEFPTFNRDDPPEPISTDESKDGKLHHSMHMLHTNFPRLMDRFNRTEDDTIYPNWDFPIWDSKLPESNLTELATKIFFKTSVCVHPFILGICTIIHVAFTVTSNWQNKVCQSAANIILGLYLCGVSIGTVALFWWNGLIRGDSIGLTFQESGNLYDYNWGGIFHFPGTLEVWPSTVAVIRDLYERLPRRGKVFGSMRPSSPRKNMEKLADLYLAIVQSVRHNVEGEKGADDDVPNEEMMAQAQQGDWGWELDKYVGCMWGFYLVAALIGFCCYSLKHQVRPCEICSAFGSFLVFSQGFHEVATEILEYKSPTKVAQDLVDRSDETGEELCRIVLKKPRKPTKSDDKTASVEEARIDLAICNEGLLKGSQKFVDYVNLIVFGAYFDLEFADNRNKLILRSRLKAKAELEELVKRAEGAKQLEGAKKQLEDANKELAKELAKQLEAQLKAKAELEEAQLKAKAELEQLEGAKKQLEGAKKQLEGAKEQLEGAKKQLEGAKKLEQLQDAKKRLEGAKEQLEQLQLAGALKALKALKELDDSKTGVWFHYRVIILKSDKTSHTQEKKGKKTSPDSWSKIVGFFGPWVRYLVELVVSVVASDVVVPSEDNPISFAVARSASVAAEDSIGIADFQVGLSRGVYNLVRGLVAVRTIGEAAPCDTETRKKFAANIVGKSIKEGGGIQLANPQTEEEQSFTLSSQYLYIDMEKLTDWKAGDWEDWETHSDDTKAIGEAISRLDEDKLESLVVFGLASKHRRKKHNANMFEHFTQIVGVKKFSVVDGAWEQSLIRVEVESVFKKLVVGLKAEAPENTAVVDRLVNVYMTKVAKNQAADFLHAQYDKRE